MKFQVKRLGGVLALAYLFLAGCGGGGGGGGGNNPPPVNPPPTGGITRTGVTIAVGPITGFGSVIVNGISYETNASTEFTKDGQGGLLQSAFSVGQVVLIQGTIDDDNTNAVAASVEYDENVEGPVSSIDNGTDTIVVLGQTVLLTTNTSIDDGCPAALGELDGLLGVAAVEVSGSVNDDRAVVATRIECKSIAGELEVTGVIAAGSLDTGVKTFMINALVVDYSGVAVLQDFPGGVVSEGDLVEAKDSDGGGLGGSGELVATSLEFKGDRFAENEGDHMEVEGFITDFVSDEDFVVNSIPVTTIPGTTVYEGGDASNLNNNLKVEVEGEFNDAMVLVATKVEIKQATAVRVSGIVDSRVGDVLTILQITVNTERMKTRFEDNAGDPPLDTLEIGDIDFPDYVEVRGQESPAGEIFAFIVERDDPEPETELRGFVTDTVVAAPTLTVFGVTIQTTPGVTEFVDSRGSTEVEFATENDFWAAVSEGSLIDAKGTETGPNVLLADEVELEMQ